MNDFNAWLSQFADEDSEAGEFVRQVWELPDWPDDPNTNYMSYSHCMFRPPWGSEISANTRPLQNLWSRYISDRLGPVAVPPELDGAARALAVALEQGTLEEVKVLCRETRLEPDERDLLLARALQVDRVCRSDPFASNAHGTEPDLLERVARMRIFAMVWHTSPDEASGFVPRWLDDDDVVNIVKIRDPSWLAEFGRCAGWRYGLVQQLWQRLGVTVATTPDIVRSCLLEHADRVTDAREPRTAIANRLREDVLAADILAMLPGALDAVGWCLNAGEKSAVQVVTVAVDHGLIDRKRLIAAFIKIMRVEACRRYAAGYVSLLEQLEPTEEEFKPCLDVWIHLAAEVPGMNKKLLSRTVTALVRLDRLSAGQVERWVRALRQEPTRVAANAATALTALAGDSRHLTGEHVADVLRVVVDGPSGKAIAAMGCVAAFWEAGLLADEQVIAWAGQVLFRPERTVANAVVRLLGQALRADPGRAEAYVPVLAEAFAHPAADTQDKALALIAKYHGRLGGKARALVAQATKQLPTAVRCEAEVLLQLPGEEFDRSEVPGEVAPPHVDLLPEPAPAGPVVPHLRDAQEVAVELGAVLRARILQPLAVERVLDGLVRLALSDRQALGEALQPVLRSYENRRLAYAEMFEVGLVALAVTGQAAPDARVGPDWNCGHRVFDAAITARMTEVAQRIEAGEALPFLLATPTLSTGEIEPHVLLERLREYRRRGVRVGAADFDQALLRLRPDPGVPHTAAEELGTPEGHRLARWMAHGLFPPPASERAVILPFTYPDDPEAASGYPTGWNLDALKRATSTWGYRLGPLPPWAPPGAAPNQPWEFEPGMVRIGDAGVIERLEGFSPAFRAVGEAYQARQNHCGCVSQHWLRMFPLWLAVLPAHPDVVVTRTLTLYAEGAERDRPSAAVHLPAVADAAGPAGPAVHLALAYGMGAAKAAERIAAADALLSLAGRSELDTDRLGGSLVELIGIDALKPKRIAQTLRMAALAAPAGVHAVLAVVLPPILPQDAGPARAGLADLLAVAVECAEAAPGRPPITGVPAVAARGGTSLLVKTARRLLSLYAGEAQGGRELDGGGGDRRGEAGAANPVQADRPTSSPPLTCPTFTSPAASKPNSRLKVRGERSPDGSG
ncbi:DUF6493 family protein [Streptomyces griseofuscus]|uniref:DUF7824 domain-containing protein n=1 Tax=Streptomyces griseofuscus TaxID=146922 RepID=UPI003676EAFE